MNVYIEEIDNLINKKKERILDSVKLEIINIFKNEEKIKREDSLVEKVGSYSLEDYNSVKEFLDSEFKLKNDNRLDEGKYILLSLLDYIEDYIEELLNDIVRKKVTKMIKSDEETFIETYADILPINSFNNSNFDNKIDIAVILIKKGENHKILQNIFEKITSEIMLLDLEEVYKEKIVEVENNKLSTEFEKIVKRKKDVYQKIEENVKEERELILFEKISKLISIEYFLKPELKIAKEYLYNKSNFEEGLKLIILSLLSKELVTEKELNVFFKEKHKELVEDFNKIFEVVKK